MRRILPRTSADVALLFRMWNAGASRIDIARQFNISVSTVYDWQRRYKLPRRKIDLQPQSSEPPPPSPEDEAASLGGLALSPWVEERARACRERHYAQRRNERDDNTRSKVSRWAKA